MQPHRYTALAATLALLAGGLHTAAADAQTKRRAQTPAAEPAACAGIRNDYDMSAKRVSLHAARAMLASGAEAIQARQASSNSLAEANAAAGLLRDNKCKAPTYAPSAARFQMQGLKCWSDMRTTVGRPDSCILENWKPE